MNATTEIMPLENTLALTPALSPKERGNCFRRAGKIERRWLVAARRSSTPSPGGESWGEDDQPRPANENLQTLKRRPLKNELWFFAGLILLLNLPLLNGNWASTFAFHPNLVRQGEWWRVLTFPFVHVSGYHLALDATAFFLLYSGLREQRRFNRLALVVTSALGSLLASLFAAPQIYSVGLCGLSGVAHGLMAVSALEMMQTKDDKKIIWMGAISLLFVIGKAALEAITDEVVFSQLHFGNLGTPIAVCHAGGILGALVVMLKIPTFASLNSNLCTSTCS